MVKNCLRDLGFKTGILAVGETNTLGDVPGVRVGHATVISPNQGGPACTGLTVILPHAGCLYRQKVVAAVHTINGYGKAVGFEQVRELGLIEAPIALTNTLNIGLVLDALIQRAIEQAPEIGADPDCSSVNIVVGETNDGYLNDLRGRHVKARHVAQACQNAVEGAVLQGSLGAGTGTVCFGWKGGIGSASRIVATPPGTFVLGALVQTNFGRSRDLTVLGVPVGRSLTPPTEKEADAGSVMVVLGTDAPLDSHHLQRVCGRVAAGLARTGAQFAQGSGDFVIGFSTAQAGTAPQTSRAFSAAQMNDPALIDPFFRAAAEAVEEAVYNSLASAETTHGRDGHVVHALPLDRVAALLHKAGLQPA